MLIVDRSLLYPRRVKYPFNKEYPCESKCKKIRGSQKRYINFFFIKKTMFCSFLATLWLPRLKEMPTFANKGSKEQRVWHRKKK